jgi:hypothetical protein
MIADVIRLATVDIGFHAITLPQPLPITLIMTGPAGAIGADGQAGQDGLPGPQGAQGPPGLAFSGGTITAATSVRQTTVGSIASDNPVGYSLRAGPGTPIGPPPTAPTAVFNGVGELTGTYQYAYGEQDGTGFTSLSPVASITAAGNKIRVTIPLPRRGVTQRILYRKNPSASVFAKVWESASGVSYFQQTWDDNIPDATVAAAAAAPTTDTTALYNLEVHEAVKTFRTHPNLANGAADVTLLTANMSAPGGAWALDAYGTIVARAALSNPAFAAFANGDDAAAFYVGHAGNHADGADFTTRYQIRGTGIVSANIGTLKDQGAGGSTAQSLSAAFPVTCTAQQFGVLWNIAGAGSSAFNQTALSVNLDSGYTGTGKTYAYQSTNWTNGAGTKNLGVFGQSPGVGSNTNVGLQGTASGGTRNVGVFGNCGSSDAFAVGTESSGGTFSNGGVSANAIIQGFHGATKTYDLRVGSALLNTNVFCGDGQRGFWCGDVNSFNYGISKSATGSAANTIIYANGTAITIAPTKALRFHGYGAGTLTTDALGNVTATSDERLKDIAGTFDRGLSAVLALKPVTYRWNQASGFDTANTYAGFSAQNVCAAIPEAIASQPDGMLALQDRPLIAALVNAVKELAAKVSVLEAQQI